MHARRAIHMCYNTVTLWQHSRQHWRAHVNTTHAVKETAFTDCNNLLSHLTRASTLESSSSQWWSQLVVVWPRPPLRIKSMRRGGQCQTKLVDDHPLSGRPKLRNVCNNLRGSLREHRLYTRRANFFFGRTSDFENFSCFVNLPFSLFYGKQHCLRGL